MRARREGFETVSLAARDGGLRATFVPAAGMVCCSLRADGDDEELLAQRDGVRAYAQRGATMGIPLLYPWANRLGGLDYAGPNGPVQLSRTNALLKFDANGLPIHGVLAGALAWKLLDVDDAGASLRARLRWQRDELLAIFPWRHEVELRVGVEASTLTIQTRVRASDEPAPAAMPVTFGYHPYLALAHGERATWQVELPVSRRLALDERKIPTGSSEPFDRNSFRLAGGDWDAAFAGLTEPRVFAASAGRARVELELLRGYDFAQLYAPAGERFVCFEPMTAPTNALRSRQSLPLLAPGEVFDAAFTISVA